MKSDHIIFFNLTWFGLFIYSVISLKTNFEHILSTSWNCNISAALAVGSRPETRGWVHPSRFFGYDIVMCNKKIRGHCDLNICKNQVVISQLMVFYSAIFGWGWLIKADADWPALGLDEHGWGRLNMVGWKSQDIAG